MAYSDLLNPYALSDEGAEALLTIEAADESPSESEIPVADEARLLALVEALANAV